MPLLLCAENLSKIYNRRKPDEMTALEDVSLEIRCGEVVALTGPSGSGKTTLLSLLGCMSRPTAGVVKLHERQVSKLPEHFMARIRRETFGLVFQQYHLLREVSVLENVMLPLYPTDLSPQAMKKAAHSVLERFEMLDKQHKKVRQLSGGEQQRTALARALVGQPEIVIADEPTAHLDSRLAGELLEIFRELNTEGKTIIIATHDPTVIGSTVVQRSIQLRHGRLVGDNEP